MDFIMAMGVAGSGKSYTSQKYKETHLILSSDEIRAELGLGQEDKDHKMVFATLHERLKNALKEDKNVYYDATNLSEKKRTHTLREIKKYSPHTKIIVHVTDINLCHKGNESRDRVVPRGVINEMSKNFTMPFFHEGWDEIEIITRSEKNYNIDEDYKNGVYHIPQDNPHHTLHLDDHMLKVHENLKELTSNKLLIMAGLLHDVGKLSTKAFKDQKGNPTEHAHYYRHENISSQLAMLYLENSDYTEEEKLEICFYVQKHMFKITDMKPSTKKKYINLYGEERYNNLLLFSKADMLGK